MLKHLPFALFALLGSASAIPSDPFSPSGATRVVDQMSEAYNAHDLERFVSFFSEDVGLQILGDNGSIERGRPAIRRTTRATFNQAPEARIELVHRIVHGPYVIDQERLVGLPGGQTIETVVILEVREGKVVNLWSLPGSPHA